MTSYYIIKLGEGWLECIYDGYIVTTFERSRAQQFLDYGQAADMAESCGGEVIAVEVASE